VKEDLKSFNNTNNRIHISECGYLQKKTQKHIDKSLYVVYNIEKHRYEVSRWNSILKRLLLSSRHSATKAESEFYRFLKTAKNAPAGF